MSHERSIGDVEACLRQQCSELGPPLRDVCLAAVEGGRRIRASLLLAAVECKGAAVIKAACALEMLHAATLLQDDIFDHGEVRRGRPASHLRFGSALTILASDWLLIRSLELASEVHPKYFRHLARTSSTMVHTVAKELQAHSAEDGESARSFVNEVAHGKTAALFASTLYVAALLHPGIHLSAARWEVLGQEIGMVYQLLDDCMDLYAEPDSMGKQSGTDRREQRLTQPLLLASQWLAERTPAKVSDAHPPDRVDPQSALQIERILPSAEMRARLERHLCQRLAEIQQTASEIGLPREAARVFTAEVQHKMDLCFRHQNGSAEP